MAKKPTKRSGPAKPTNLAKLGAQIDAATNWNPTKGYGKGTRKKRTGHLTGGGF